MTPHPDALGWTLLHFCWQAALIAFAYAAIDSALHNAGSRTRYGLAVAALLAMVVAAAATLIHEIGAIQIAAPDISAIGAPDGMPVSTTGRALLPAMTDSPGIGALLPWLDLLWLAGVICLSVRAFGGYHVLGRFVRATDPDVPEQLAVLVRGLCDRLGISRPVMLRLSRQTCGPFVVGVMRAVIVVPVSALTMLSPAQLEAVLAHELAHVRRGDFLWNILQTIVETLFFFHPAVWWVGRRLRTERELCCDDMALAACGDPLTYASALVALERARVPSLRLAQAIDGHRPGVGLRSRVDRILGTTPARSWRIMPLLLFAGMASAALLLSPLPVARADDGASPQPPRLHRTSAARHHPMLSVTVRARTKISVVDRASPARVPSVNVTARPPARPAPTASPAPEDYAGAMRAAGYADDDRFLPSLQEAGVPPDYVRGLAAFDLGTPMAKQIRMLWTRGMRPSDIRALQAAGAQPAGWRDMVGFSLYGVTPAFISAMRAAGFDAIEPGKLIMLGKLGVTPDDARAAKRANPDLDIWHLIHQRLVETGAWHPPGWSGGG